MQGVKCKVCGHHHPGVDHIWPDEPKRKAAPVAPEPVAAPRLKLIADPPTVKRGRGRPATGFDKKAYQRELMRKRRAAAKSSD